MSPADTKAIAQAALARNRARPKPLRQDQIDAEKSHCKADVTYFVNTYVYVYDNDSRAWIHFILWTFQTDALSKMCTALRLIVLKTRQVGLTWLALAYALWQMVFWPIAEVLLFSQREDEALALLGEQRLHGMYEKLPDWMKPQIVLDNKSELRFDNGSGARALPGTSGGDSRTVTLVIIDEADLVDDPERLVTRAKPTLGTKGQMFIIGRADKSRPTSYFKRLYRDARSGDSEWVPIFIPWFAHPKRDQAWYDAEVREIERTTGSRDGMHEHYPATEQEALQARTLDKRIPPQWLAAVFTERDPLPLPADAPVIPGLRIFVAPDPNRKYGIGADPAGGTSDGDDAACHVIDTETLEQVACFYGKIEPTQFANYVADLATYYNGAVVLFELNNHGQAMLSQLKERRTNLRMGITRDGSSGKPGWLTTERSKNMLYDVGTKVLQEIIIEAEHENVQPHPILFDFNTYMQLASVDASTLAAPEGQHDDLSMAWVLAQMCVYRGVPSMMQQRYSGLYKRDAGLPEGVSDKLNTLQAVMKLGKPPLPELTPEEVNDTVRDLIQEHKNYLKQQPGETQEQWAWRIRFRGR